MPLLLYKEWFQRKKTIYIHLICWSIFILYEISIIGIISQHFQRFNSYALFYLLNISLFYFHSLVVLHPFAKSTMADLWRIPLLLILELTLYCILTSLFSYYLTQRSVSIFELPIFSTINLANTIWRGSYFILYGTGYYFLIRYNQKKERTLTQAIENEKLENSLLRTEQDFLRAQINPHLLFNSLNFIRYAIRKRPAEADDAIMRLAGMMGFALESTTGTIPLSRELEQIDNLIALNQLRFNHALYLNYSTDIHDPETPTIPIILLTLVENVFKHGDLRNEESPAFIKIESTPAYLLFESSNLAIENNSVKSNKTGIQNISLRLDQFYKNQYRFSHELQGNIYKVVLKIDYQPK